MAGLSASCYPVGMDGGDQHYAIPVGLRPMQYIVRLHWVCDQCKSSHCTVSARHTIFEWSDARAVSPSCEALPVMRIFAQRIFERYCDQLWGSKPGIGALGP